MAEYRAKIEQEKRNREELMRVEREAAESRMRADYEAEMLKVQEQLQLDKHKAQLELEKERQELIKQREDFDKKKLDEQEQQQKEEKARIVATFEKENQASLETMEKEKQNQKAKLKDRLAEKRTLAAMARADLLSITRRSSSTGIARCGRNGEFDSPDGNGDSHEGCHLWFCLPASSTAQEGSQVERCCRISCTNPIYKSHRIQIRKNRICYGCLTESTGSIPEPFVIEAKSNSAGCFRHGGFENFALRQCRQHSRLPR
jgi:hypothetical protein